MTNAFHVCFPPLISVKLVPAGSSRVFWLLSSNLGLGIIMAVAQTKVRSYSSTDDKGAMQSSPKVPWYMEQVYWWAYMRPFSLALFDHVWIVSLILFGNYGKLKRAALTEIRNGQSVLQAACVYGDLSGLLAEKVGRAGTLDVIDVVPLQVANCSRKLLDYPWARVRLADAASPGGKLYDSVCCFFLLHELPDDYKRSVLNALLASVPPGGKAIIVDYHKPSPLNPLRPVLSLIFRFLEPFAGSLWQNGIRDFAQDHGAFIWRKETFFGGMFQKVVAKRKTPGLRAISSTE